MADAEPTPPPEPSDVRRPGRRWLRRVAWAASAILGLALAAYLLREQVVHPLLVRALPHLARSAASIELSLDELHGDWFTDLSIVGLRIEPPGAGPLRELDVQRAEVEYSLLAWARGDREWLRGAEVRGVRAELDLTGPSEPATDAGAPVDPAQLLARLPGLDASDVEVEIDLPGERRARARVERAELERPGAAARAFELEAALLEGTLHAKGELSGSAIEGRLTFAGASLPAVLELAGTELATRGSASLSIEARLPWADPLSGTATAELEADGLELEGRPLEVVDASVRLQGGQLVASRIELRSGENHVIARDATLPVAALGNEAPHESLTADVELDLRDLARLIAPDREAPPHRLVVHGRVEPGRAYIHRGALEVPGGNIDLQKGEVSLVDAGGGQRRVHLDLDVDLGDLSALDEILGLGEWSGSLAGSLALDADADDVEGSVHLVGAEVVAAGAPLGDLVLDASADRTALHVAQLASDGEAGSVHLVGTYRFAEESLEGVTLEAAVTRLDRFDPSLAGAASVELEASGPWRAPGGTLRVEASDIVFGGQRIDALSLAAGASDGTFRVTHLDAWAAGFQGSTRLSGALPWVDPAAAELDLRVEDLCLARDGTALELAHPTRLRVSDARVALAETRLRGSAGEVLASFEHRGAHTRATLVADLSDTGPLLAPILGPERVGGSVWARLELDARPGSYVAHTSGSARSLLLPWLDGPTQVDWRAVLSPAGLDVSELTASAMGRRFLDVRADLPVDPTADSVLAEGPIALHLQLTDPPWSLPPLPLGEVPARASGSLSAEVELGGTWRRPTGSVRVDLGEISVLEQRGEGPRELLPAAGSAKVSLVLEDRVALETLQVEIPGAARAEVHGSAELPLDLRAWLEGGVDAGGSPLDLEGQLEWTQLEWLVREIEGLRRLSGRGEGELVIAGTLGAPEVSGGLRVHEGNLRLESDVPPLTELEADLRFDASKVRLASLSAQLGAAPLEATGSLDLQASPPALDLHLTGDNVLLQRSTNVLLRADADLSVQGPLDALAITGSVGLRNGRMTQTIDLLGFLEGGRRPSTTGLQLFSIRTGPLATARFDVAVETREPFQVRTNMAQASMRMSLRITGTGEVPTPAGDIFVDDAKVKLPAGVVDFSSGLVRFEPSDPFVPKLELRGDARLLGYDVTIQVTESYDDPEIVLSSSPPLANDQVLALMLTGQPPRGSGNRGQATNTVALYLMQDLFARWTAGGVDSFDDSLLSRFEMASGREISDSGLATIEATYRLHDGVLTSNDQLYLVGDRDVYEFYNFGLRLVFRLR